MNDSSNKLFVNAWDSGVKEYMIPTTEYIICIYSRETSDIQKVYEWYFEEGCYIALYCCSFELMKLSLESYTESRSKIQLYDISKNTKISNEKKISLLVETIQLVNTVRGNYVSIPKKVCNEFIKSALEEELFNFDDK